MPILVEWHYRVIPAHFKRSMNLRRPCKEAIRFDKILPIHECIIYLNLIALCTIHLLNVQLSLVRCGNRKSNRKKQNIVGLSNLPNTKHIVLPFSSLSKNFVQKPARLSVLDISQQLGPSCCPGNIMFCLLMMSLDGRYQGAPLVLSPTKHVSAAWCSWIISPFICQPTPGSTCFCLGQV